MLEAAGRIDVPVGVGIHLSDDVGPQQEWIEDYQLSSYRGYGLQRWHESYDRNNDEFTHFCDVGMH